MLNVFNLTNNIFIISMAGAIFVLIKKYVDSNFYHNGKDQYSFNFHILVIIIDLHFFIGIRERAHYWPPTIFIFSNNFYTYNAILSTVPI